MTLTHGLQSCKHFEELIRRLRATGRYQNDSEILRAASPAGGQRIAPALSNWSWSKLEQPRAPLEKNWAQNETRSSRSSVARMKSYAAATISTLTCVASGFTSPVR